jgi:GH24 family phage-related lysozyme (muramidase)
MSETTSYPLNMRYHTRPARDLLERAETVVLVAYKDRDLKTGGHHWAIGLGHTNRLGTKPVVFEGMKISYDDAMRIADQDLGEIDRQLNKMISSRAKGWMYQEQWNALVSFTFNKGQTWVKKHLLSFIEAGKWDEIPKIFMREVPKEESDWGWLGFRRRRTAESRMWERKPMNDILNSFKLPRSYFK